MSKLFSLLILILLFSACHKGDNDSPDNPPPSTPGKTNLGLFINSNDGYVYALDASGNLKWKHSVGKHGHPDGGFYSNPTLDNGVIYAEGWPYSLYAIDAITGQKKWSSPLYDPFLGGNQVSTAVVWNGTVYVNAHHRLYALDPKNGAIKWEVLSSGGYLSPTILNGIVYDCAYTNGVAAIDANNGNVLWRFKPSPSTWIHSGPSVVDGIVYFGGYGNDVYAINAKTGSLVWHFSTYGVVTASPTVVNNTVYVSSNTFYLYALDAKTGNQKWRSDTIMGYTPAFHVDSSPFVAEGSVFVGSQDSSIYCLDANTGNTKWELKTGARVVSSPVVSNGTLYIGSNDRNIYSIDAKTGKVNWKYLTDGEVWSSACVVTSDSSILNSSISGYRN